MLALSWCCGEDDIGLPGYSNETLAQKGFEEKLNLLYFMYDGTSWGALRVADGGPKSYAFHV